MGALQKIRSKSTLLVTVVAIGLLAFIMPWDQIVQAFNMSKYKAFVVNGEVVEPRQYSERIEQTEELEKIMSRNPQISESRAAEIREQVFQMMVSEKLLAEQAEKLGLAVTDAELNDMATDYNMSPILYQLFGNMQTGEFDRQQLNMYLSAVNEPLSSDPQMRAQQQELRKTWAFIEDMMRFNRLSEKYAALVAGSVLVNDVEAKSYFEESRNVANVAYVVSEYSDIDDASIEVTDQEIQDLYNIRKENFLSKYPSRNITYFVKEVIPSEEDFENTEAQALEVKKELAATANPAMLVSQYSDTRYVDAHIAVNSLPTEIKNFVNSSNVGDIYGPVRGDNAFTMYKYVSKVNAPDSIKIQVLPISVFDPAKAASIADSLQNVLKSGKSFIDLAREMYPNEPRVGIAEWTNEASLAMGGIAEDCMNANKGDVIKVQQGGGTFLLRVDDKTKPVNKAKVAVITMSVDVSDKTSNTIDNEINRFLAEHKDPQTFAQAALTSGYNVVENAVIYPNQPTLANISSTRDVIRWAFNESKGEVKKFETKDVRILAVVTGKTEEGYLPATNPEVKNLLKNEILKDKKADKLIADLEAKNASSLTDLAEKIEGRVDTARFVTFQTNNITNLGYEPIINVYAETGKENVISKPLKGNNGVYVLNLVDRNKDESEYNQAFIKSMLQRSYAQMLGYSASMILMDKKDVEDNRIKFY